MIINELYREMLISYLTRIPIFLLLLEISNTFNQISQEAIEFPLRVGLWTIFVPAQRGSQIDGLNILSLRGQEVLFRLEALLGAQRGDKQFLQYDNMTPQYSLLEV